MTPSLPPGPNLPALLQGLWTAFRPVDLLETCARRYGDCFTLRMPVGGPFVLFSAPDAIRDIFTGDAEVLRAGESNGILRPLLGAGSILLLDGARHARERRLMLPPFHGERMLHYGEVMRAIARQASDAWPIGRPFPMHTEMQRITLDVILRTVFGMEDGARLDRLRVLLRRLIASATNPMWLWPRLQVDAGPLSPWGRFRRLKDEIDAFLYEEFARRRQPNAPPRDDVLSLLLAARDEEGRPMRDDDLRDEMVTLLLAGHETTATALAWAFHHVLGDASVLRAIRAELAGAAESGSGATAPSGTLPYLDATIKETLRLTPILPDVGRRLARPTSIGGRELPAGVVAGPCIYLAHRRADVWSDPATFRPARFLGARPSPYEFFPFGGGARRCLGMAFALYEMRVVLAEVLSRVELTAASAGSGRVVRRSITLAPSGGMPVVVLARAA